MPQNAPEEPYTITAALQESVLVSKNSQVGCVLFQNNRVVLTTTAHRPIRDPWQHHCEATRHPLPSRSTRPSSLSVNRGALLNFLNQVKIGRDHTLYATVPGFVRFYKEKWMRGERRYVGVVLERGDVLPRDEASLGRSRFCGLVDRSSPQHKAQSLQG